MLTYIIFNCTILFLAIKISQIAQIYQNIPECTDRFQHPAFHRLNFIKSKIRREDRDIFTVKTEIKTSIC